MGIEGVLFGVAARALRVFCQAVAGHDLAHHDELLEDVGLLGLLQHDAVGVVDELAVGGVNCPVF
jgi:hypothetical protein